MPVAATITKGKHVLFANSVRCATLLPLIAVSLPQCEACSAGDMICCSKGTVTGIHHNGGYQEYMVSDTPHACITVLHIA
jgi:D-arabinose 1-dehydrogenase-like Zn-dependent alcohol dehydrogenase